jgi:uncharacterized protein YbaP (TraB family)
MIRTLLIAIFFVPYLLHAQTPVKKTKYPSLLWEIRGAGLKKPSYLFGTMHVSSKMAFHLADSFYIGLRNADMVALETNPESWQEDMSKYDLGTNGSDLDFGRYLGIQNGPDDYLTINTLRFYKYDKKIERTLYSNPSTINNLLYRTYGNESSDFEEDTYLDMYIYQCGKKWGKKVAGVEKYGESMKLMAEAYRDAAKDKDKKSRNVDPDDGYGSGNLQEAYRTGNLDWLDSINRYNSFSLAFDEKFLYRRNEIQANSIDSILKTGQSLFVGVGAAHLPGNRGVIEMLRNRGYKVRPVKMGERDSQHKNQVEKLRVPVVFHTQTADDGMYKVDIPGKFYQSGDDPALEQKQYADMANGSYYMVTRIMTNAWMWGHNTQRVREVIDSLLYENIPGKIISKTDITRNGYSGIDITNRTRRGDVQRYNIFTTPFEIIIFKMSGTGDYVRLGGEAKRFFGSIQLREFGAGQLAGWKKYSPVYGGFAVNFPHDPYVGNDGSWIYDAEDKSTRTHYRVIRTDVHNHRFVEEDTFDLSLMEESFGSSEFINKQVSRQHTKHKGYPALDVRYSDKSGGIYLVKFIIQGPHYYTLVAHASSETPQLNSFLNSFEIRPYQYRAAKPQIDTLLYYSVKSPVFPEPDKERLDIPAYTYQALLDDNEDSDEGLERGAYRSKIISNDSTGEQIFVSFYKLQRYVQYGDSTALFRRGRTLAGEDTAWLIRSHKQSKLSNGTTVWETLASDTGSSRAMWSKGFYRDGVGYLLITETDTLTKPSDFLVSFFSSFAPSDTLRSLNPFHKKSQLFFDDFLSKDTVAHKRAVRGLYAVKFDSTDLSGLKRIIASMNWKEKKYLDTKKALIGKLDAIPTRASSDYLKELYYAAGDTIELQYTALEVLLQQKTKYAFTLFRDIVLNEPPVLNFNSSNRWSSFQDGRGRSSGFDPDNGNFMDELYDSLALTKHILPEILPLLNLDDYKFSVMRLLGRMIDSGLVKPAEYESYYSKFFLEAKQELKKQVIAEKKKSIEKAEKEKGKEMLDFLVEGAGDRDIGNEKLQLYATLLLPFHETKPGVPGLIAQMLNSYDNRLRYNTLILLLRNQRPAPDSLLMKFAGMDEYRYELYDDLRRIGKSSVFPLKYNNHADLSRSKLIGIRPYNIPDSIAYLDRFAAEIGGKKGLVYFYRYKNQKDDISWKVAMVGLVPDNPTEFDFEDDNDEAPSRRFGRSNRRSFSLDFTRFTDERLNPELTVSEQLQKQLRKLAYSYRKSAKEFYESDTDDSRGFEIFAGGIDE